MRLTKNYTGLQDKVIRFGLAMMALKGLDQDHFIKYRRSSLESLRYTAKEDGAEVRQATKSEHELAPYAEIYMESQFLFPLDDALEDINTEVDFQLIAYACAVSVDDYSDEAVAIREMAKKESDIALKAHILGYKDPLFEGKITRASSDDISSLSIKNPIALLYLDRDLINAEHWNQAVLRAPEMVAYAPADMIDEDIFRMAISSSADGKSALNDFLRLPGNSLSGVQDIYLEEMLSICKKIEFDLSLTGDFFNNHSKIDIIKSNPLALGSCSFMGRDYDVDRAAVISSVTGLNQDYHPAVIRASDELLVDIISDNAASSEAAIRSELSARGIPVDSLNNELNLKAKIERHIDSMSVPHSEEVSEYGENNQPKDLSLAALASVKFRSLGMDENWLIDNFSSQLSKLRLSFDMGEISSEIIRNSDSGEHPLMPYAEYFMMEQFASPIYSQKFGIPVEISDQLIIDFCLEHEKYAKDIMANKMGNFDNTVFDVARDSDDLLLKLYSKGFSVDIGHICDVDQESIRELAIFNPAAIAFLESGLISDENAKIAMLRDINVTKFIDPDSIDPEVFVKSIFLKDDPKYNIENTSVQRILRKYSKHNPVITCMVNKTKLLSMYEIMDEQSVAAQVMVHKSLILGNSELKDISPIMVTAAESSYHDPDLHVNVIGMMNPYDIQLSASRGSINLDSIQDGTAYRRVAGLIKVAEKEAKRYPDFEGDFY